MDIKLLKLYCNPFFLLPVVKYDTQKSIGEGNDFTYWWERSAPELKSNIFKKRGKDQNIDAVCFILAQLDKITIFCHSYNSKSNYFSNPQVIANEDIKEVKSLLKVKVEPKQGDMVYAEWEDATINPTPASFEEIEKADGLAKLSQTGFLIHKNARRTFIGGRFSHDYEKYKHLEAIPTVNILKMVKLQVK